MKRNSGVLQRFVSILFIVVSLSYLAGSLSLPLGSARRPGPGFAPLCIGISLTSLSLFYCLKVFLFQKKSGEEVFFGQKGDLFRVTGVISILVLYGVFFGTLGYIISTVILVMVVLRLLGMRPWLQIIMISILVSGGSYYLFSVILGVPLPRGVL